MSNACTKVPLALTQTGTKMLRRACLNHTYSKSKASFATDVLTFFAHESEKRFSFTVMSMPDIPGTPHLIQPSR